MLRSDHPSADESMPRKLPATLMLLWEEFCMCLSCLSGMSSWLATFGSVNIFDSPGTG